MDRVIIDNQESEPFMSVKQQQTEKDTFNDITFQIQCLKELYDELYPKMSNQSENAFNKRKTQRKLRELKAILRNQYRDNCLLPTNKNTAIYVFFDFYKKPFFILMHRSTYYPKNMPLFTNDNQNGTISLYSEAIYKKTIEAFADERKLRTERRTMITSKKSSKEVKTTNNAILHSQNNIRVYRNLPIIGTIDSDTLSNSSDNESVTNTLIYSILHQPPTVQENGHN